MDEPSDRKPGDILLDTYFPDADTETRERAREAFLRLGLIWLRWGNKIEQGQVAGNEDSTH